MRDSSKSYCKDFGIAYWRKLDGGEHITLEAALALRLRDLGFELYRDGSGWFGIAKDDTRRFGPHPDVHTLLTHAAMRIELP